MNDEIPSYDSIFLEMSQMIRFELKPNKKCLDPRMHSILKLY